MSMEQALKLESSQIDFFEKNGYLEVGVVLSAQELQEARTAYDAIFNAEEKPQSYRNLGKKDGEEVSAGAVLQIIDMYRLHPIFERIMQKPIVLDIIESLMGHPNINLYHDQALYKPALNGDIVPWHQDNGYWKLDPPAAMSLWIALDDADTENGCMWVVPGSQKSGEAGHQRAGQYVAQLKADADESLAVAVPVSAGSGMIHHCQTLHMTRPNLSPRQRRAWVIHFIPAGIFQNGELLKDRVELRTA